ncbi:carboxypeptidase-like regulatory domain-containing protein [Mucilaginibacter psychrotolerans]|uniref:Carboxypeptidase-like regulatory domain-containing protein n=1 Tax=Mucilaginibacter psychrotolerans TaxID=1524096 RepID=A0A4Y8SNN9_9SPHI|nr:carboxypeptidase-like regulatory domain-containing protein [Mucilaginibacter psychrotolerans]TFF40713.1 carboxypeptidase-like regulatory domain-containing protein [Mucilaginibacter psychrotolerans]
MRYCFLLFLLAPFATLAQITITGKVINAADNKPIANASVFLSNATVGDKTAEDGSFSLRNVKPGQYEFVVSVVGFDAYRETVRAANEPISLTDIKLLAKTTQLKEVKVVIDNDWESNLQKFKDEFLGTSAAARDCKIVDADALSLDYDKSKRILTGSSYDFLVIENKYLGYRIKYLLNKFEKNEQSGLLYYEGSSTFEEMPGSLNQKRRWKKRRRETYLGSSMHFLRSLIVDSTAQEGFVIYRLIRKPNPAFDGLNDKYIQTLIKTPITASTFVHPTDLPGMYAIGFEDCFYIKYNKSSDATILTINANYAFFDQNGIVANPAYLLVEGEWGRYRIAELLPVDYEPVGDK